MSKDYDLPGGLEFVEVKNFEEFDRFKRRFYIASKCKTYFELADFLETTASKISDAKRRLRIPQQWFDIVFRKTATNPHWLLTGEGEKTRLLYSYDSVGEDL